MSRDKSVPIPLPVSFPRVSGDEPAAVMTPYAHLRCFPRVSGDEPTTNISVTIRFEFSPRERG